jgi:hypothetical protein
MFGLAVLFLAPTPSLALLDLARALRGGWDGAPDGWVPHVTILMDEPDALTRAIPVLAREFEPFQARIERVALWEFHPARCVEEYRLLSQ